MGTRVRAKDDTTFLKLLGGGGGGRIPPKKKRRMIKKFVRQDKIQTGSLVVPNIKLYDC